MSAIPAIGTRFLFSARRVKQPMKRDAKGQWILERSGAYRVWELVETVPLEGLRNRHNPNRHGCDRHTIRVVEEAGFTPAYSYGVGFEAHVEDAWFGRGDFKVLTAEVA